MNVSQHEQDASEYETTIAYLRKDGLVKHRKLIVEGCVLASTNLANLALHKLNKLPESKDLKHNRIEGFIKREKYFGEYSNEVAMKHRKLEDLKYGIVHGKNKREEDIVQAIEIYEKIKMTMGRIMENAK